ncbi:MAG: response regulator [Rhizomicrobium sp.]
MEGKLNFSQVAALIVDGDNYATGILGQILRGFGLTRHTIASDGETAQRLFQGSHYDLVICEYVLQDMQGADFVRWIRRLPDARLKTVPVILLTGYTQFSNVAAARDSGANIVIKKPIAPNVLIDHIAWSAEGERPFIETNNYIGPCRRFKCTGPPGGIGRRSTDLSADVGAAIEPNMSQDEIDSFIKPTKVSIE